MDGVKSRYSAKTADPSTALRSGRDDKGRGVAQVGVVSGIDRVGVVLREDCRSLHSATLRLIE
jgi:hypothetical protein